MKLKELEKCMLCPRNCGVNRYLETGFCNTGSKIKLSYYSKHMWEEPIISGDKGSGTIFFSNCNLKCLFCQNKKISIDNYGKEISDKRFQEIILKLQDEDVHNINLVTPTMYVPQIVYNINKIKDKINIPIIYNTSSYENVDTIKMLDNTIDIYLVDFKYYDNKLGEKYSNCTNYYEVASASIDEMYKQVGKFQVKDNLMTKGLIIRILVLPGEVNDAIKIIDYIYSKYGDNVIISIMNQYTPTELYKYSNLNRKLSDDEYSLVVNHAYDLGIRYCFIQEGDTQKDSFIPNFDISIL